MPAALSNPYPHFSPRPLVRALDWCRSNIFTHEGKPYSHDGFPHLGAPGGPFDAFDDPRIRSIWLQFASRLAKTFFGQCCQVFSAAHDPCPMMFASADQKLAVEVVARTYKMIEQCRQLRRQLRPENRRNQDRIDLDACKIYVAWSRSVSTLADKDMRVGHANEIDKWEHQATSKEADPLKLFDDRSKNFTSFKRIKEGTPQVKGKSRIERGRLASTNCRYFVPCPHCDHYQPLEFGGEDDAHGVKWEKNQAGKSERELARSTAHYVCRSCHEKILDHHRPRMMRAGVWCPEGCDVDSAEALKIAGDGASLTDAYEWRGWSFASWITGSPVHDGPDAGYQLSSLYALSLTWGDIAAEFISCKDSAQDLRNFVNQWKGETWEAKASKQTWQELGERIISKDVAHCVVPSWGSLLTCGIDRQESHYVYTLDAWGPNRTTATIGYGKTDSLEEIRDKVIRPLYPHADGGEQVRCCFALVDSGYRPEGVYEFCRDAFRAGLAVWPCKGSNTALESDYRQTKLSENTSMPGMVLFHVDTLRTQSWMDKVTLTLKPGDEGALYLYHAALAEHQDFLEQLINDAAVSKLDSHNYERTGYERIDVAVPNDYRDCRRYSYAAMLIATRGAPIRPRMIDGAKPKPATMMIGGGGNRPDGRPWI